MRNFYKLFIVFIVVGFLFAIVPTKNAQAVNCEGKGIITYGTGATSLGPTRSVALDATFRWGTLSTADMACLDEDIFINFMVSANGLNFSLRREPIGKVGISSTRIASHFLTHAMVLANPSWLSSNGTRLDTFARAENQEFPAERNELAVIVSSHINIDFLRSLTQTFACIADDGKYACCNVSNCSDVPACSGKPTIRLDDNRKCGQLAPVPGSGPGPGPGPGPALGPGPGGGSSTELPNPIGINTFQELVNVIGVWIFNLAIPIAVIVIIYAGVIMLTAGGNPGRFQKGAKALWYAVLGLAIVFIGKGFVTLIESILSLRNP